MRRILIRAGLVALVCAGGAAVLLMRGCTMTSPYEVPPDATYSDADWAAVLAKRVDAQGRVDYEALREDRAPLERYVALLAGTGPKETPGAFPSRAHRLAYWINAYNALTIFQVTQRRPIESVDDSKLTFFYLTKFEVDGRRLSLYEIENDVVRPEFTEPRVHFALNCASGGCPRLPQMPFRPATLESQLALETQRFLSEERNVAVEGDALVLSEIFKWYGADFEPTVEAWIRERRPDLPPTDELRFRPYDWSLNAQP